MSHAIYIGLILALLAFSVWYTEKIETAGRNSCIADYEGQLRADLNSAIADNNSLIAKNSQLVTDLLNKQPEIKTVYETIEKKVNVYVKDNTACNLARGAVSLRNEAGDPEQLHPGYHPALSEAEAARPSAITQRVAERQTHEWGELYYGLKGKYVTLLSVCENNNNQSGSE